MRYTGNTVSEVRILPLSANALHCGQYRQAAGVGPKLTRAAAFQPPSWRMVTSAKMSAMLDDAEIALARAELHVIEARGRLSDQLGKIDRLKGRGEDALEAEQTLGLLEAYLSLMERHRDFLLRSQRPPAR